MKELKSGNQVRERKGSHSYSDLFMNGGVLLLSAVDAWVIMLLRSELS